jgi:lycopene cyclase domain-containing protein
MKWTYISINLGAILIPFLFSFHPRLMFYKAWPAAFKAIGLVAIIFVAWDIVYTGIGVWGFNSDYHLNITLAGLPLEEILFFLCIPYSCLFTYFSLKKIDTGISVIIPAKTLSVGISVAMLVVLAAFREHLYTAAAAISVIVSIVIAYSMSGSRWMGRFYTSYALLLIPFFIISGLLTWTGIETEVVWYNDLENSGRRILTIPVEDFAYAFALILLNVSLFERFLKKAASNIPAPTT